MFEFCIKYAASKGVQVRSQAAVAGGGGGRLRKHAHGMRACTQVVPTCSSPHLPTALVSAGAPRDAPRAHPVHAVGGAPPAGGAPGPDACRRPVALHRRRRGGLRRPGAGAWVRRGETLCAGGVSGGPGCWVLPCDHLSRRCGSLCTLTPPLCAVGRGGGPDPARAPRARARGPRGGPAGARPARAPLGGPLRGLQEVVRVPAGRGVRVSSRCALLTECALRSLFSFLHLPARPSPRRWMAIYEAQAAAGAEVCTTLPEFGPATYVPIDPKTDEPIADIREVRARGKGWASEGGGARSGPAERRTALGRANKAPRSALTTPSHCASPRCPPSPLCTRCSDQPRRGPRGVRHVCGALRRGHRARAARGAEAVTRRPRFAGCAAGRALSPCPMN
jgi:hypothetical protein